jgi:cell division septation protein DedD
MLGQLCHALQYQPRWSLDCPLAQAALSAVEESDVLAGLPSSMLPSSSSRATQAIRQPEPEPKAAAPARAATGKSQAMPPTPFQVAPVRVAQTFAWNYVLLQRTQFLN